MVCRKCESENNVKYGKMNNMQRYKCKNCGFQFTKEVSNGRSETERNKAIALYLLGLSMRTIAKLFRVNVTTVLYWIRNFATKTYDKPAQKGAVVIELDKPKQMALSGIILDNATGAGGLGAKLA